MKLPTLPGARPWIAIPRARRRAATSRLISSCCSVVSLLVTSLGTTAAPLRQPGHTAERLQHERAAHLAEIFRRSCPGFRPLRIRRSSDDETSLELHRLSLDRRLVYPLEPLRTLAP